MPSRPETGAISIRPPHADDRPIWNELWSAYLVFYRHELPAEVTDHTWQTILRNEPPLRGLLAVDEADRPVGLAHYIVHASTWTVSQYCYLEDLFVRPDYRGGGVGRALIEHLYGLADQNGWARVYWMTQETNYRGRTLYDRVGHKADFVIYERDEN